MKLGPEALADRPLGPQILLSGATNRVIDNDGWYSDAILMSYSGEIPEHVLGTDWSQPVSYDATDYDSGYHLVAYPDEEMRKAPPPVTPAVYTHPVKPTKPDKPVIVERPSYPSIDGDVIGGSEAWTQPQVVDLQQYEVETFSS
ncbi:MAG TPA: hypothetical protein VD906_08600 [Caulobacteraceae bacterium]|nr:hypothetical protein [Caulobacteraceae bacterium]